MKKFYLVADFVSESMDILIREKLFNVFPTMESGEADKIMNGLLLLGLETESDFNYLKEEDLTTLLPLIKARRFLSACQPVIVSEMSSVTPSCLFPSVTPLSPEPSTSLSSGSSNWAQLFIVNWENFPTEFLSDINSKRKPSESHIRQMVSLLMRDVLRHDHKPNRNSLRIIAQKVVSRYPDAFVDEINGKIISNGVETLMYRMESRKENANRKASLSGNCKRMKLNVHSIHPHGWDPNISSVSIDLLNAKEQLQQLFRNLPWPKKDVDKLMADTFSLQRHTINAIVPFCEVLLQWPFLSQLEYVMDHFSNLMSFSLMDNLRNAVASKSNLIFLYFETMTKKNVVKEILLEAKSIGIEYGGVQRALCWAWLPLIIAYFGDKTEHLILSVNILATISEMEDLCPTSHPMIFVKGTWFESEYFYVLIEKKLSYTFTDALSAVSVLFAIYYVMNMQYDPNVFATLEFIQRYMVDYNPENVKNNAKGKKPGTVVCPRVLTLIRELNSYSLNSV
ncbi:uncharacterized protein LOC105849988 [Hydra vulgaris]|uniref:uncharacterized protein LOC105849988 n=1 Tax=Hydra vulgaris TaxID=6087 RepID=UPI0032E9DB6E